MTYQFRQGEPFESYSAFDPAREFLSADFDRNWQGEVSGKNFDRYAEWLQQSLNKVVKLRVPLIEDGDFGTKTRNALSLFRRQARLKSSGDVVCPDTEQALIAAGANPPPAMLQARASETTPPALTLYMDIPLQIRLGNAKSMTGIFVRDGFCPVPQVDVIVYLHGFKVRVHKPEFSVAEYWKLTEFLLREEVNKSQKNVILVAPTLGPQNQPGSLTCPRGFDNFLAQVMLALKQHGPYAGQQASPSIGNIILACHSGSGSVMRAIAMGADVSAQKIQECWAFEPANMGDASGWKKWAGSRSQNKLYIYYLPGTSGKRLCAALMGRSVPKPGQVSCAPNIFAEESSAAHDEVPRAHLKDRIQGAPFLLSQSSCSVSRPQKEWTWEDEVPRNRPPYARLGRASFNRPMHLRLPVRTFDWSTSNHDDHTRLEWRNSPFELESEFEYDEVGNPPVTARSPARTARQIYASQTKVKPAVDANFSSIFSDPDKVVVIAFWAESCAPCAEAATAMTAVADRYSKGPAGAVKFYHVQWDRRVNPRVHQQFGFRSVPVVFFYYTSTGRPPSRAAPLLEGSLGHDEKHDPNRYVRTIEAILRRHAPAKVQSASERRGWKRSTDLVSKSDFADIDQLLVEPSPFQQYLLGQHRANPGVRLSKLGIIQIQNTYESTYQTVNGRRPGPDNAGTFDKKNLKLYLLSVNIQLQTYLGRAIHEAIHMFCCPVKGAFTQFHNSYGFGITEGFTQYITEEILKSQKLAIIPPSPYQHELAAVKSLIRVVGVQALAEDYFLCKKRVFDHLNRIKKYSEFWRLSRDADDQREKGSERGMIQAYQKLIRFLDAINPQPASSTKHEYLEFPWNESGPGSNHKDWRKALNHRSARRPESNIEDSAMPEYEMSRVSGRAARRVPGRRILAYTTSDVIDNRISIPAQHSLVRLSKNPATNPTAVGLLDDIKSGRLGGIFCVNWQKAAQRAIKLGKSWWTVIPPGEDAVVMLDPQDPFAGQALIAFRRELDPNCGLRQGEKRYAASPVKLDAALIKVWTSLTQMRRVKPVLCPVSTTGNTIETELPAICIANIIPPILGQLRSVKLRDITNDKNENVHAGQQDGKALPALKTEVTFCDPAGRGALLLAPVLNQDPLACGMNRFNHSKRAIPDPLRGTLAVLAETTKSASADPPSLFLVWIPDNLDPNKISVEIDFHVGLHAQPSGAAASTVYPLGTETFKRKDGTQGKSQPYIIKGFQQIMWRTWGHYQHDLAQRACVYVAPIAPDPEMFTKLTAATLARRLQEVAELVRARVVPATHSSSVSIGRVALSGFSRGGSWVSTVIANAGGAAGKEFLKRNVKEVYLFDPAGDSPQAIRKWHNSTSGSILRVYTGSSNTYQTYQPLIDPAKNRERLVRFTTKPAGEAREVNSSKGSVVFVASSLLAPARLCGSSQLGCAIPVTQGAHGWYCQFFLAHALNNSGFSPL